MQPRRRAGDQLAAPLVEEVGVGVVVIGPESDHRVAADVLQEARVEADLADVTARRDGVGDEVAAVGVLRDEDLAVEPRLADAGVERRLEIGAERPAREVLGGRRGGTGDGADLAVVDRAVLVEVAPE